MPTHTRCIHVNKFVNSDLYVNIAYKNKYLRGDYSTRISDLSIITPQINAGFIPFRERKALIIDFCY